MDTLKSYSSLSNYPKDIVPGQIYVDMKRHAILVPNSQSTFIPFHVSTIKSISANVQGQWTFLRINFHYSNGNTIQFPPMFDENNVLIKELTLKTASTNSNNRLFQAQKQIKECLTNVKQQEAAQEVKAIHGEESLDQLITQKGARRE